MLPAGGFISTLFGTLVQTWVLSQLCFCGFGSDLNTLDKKQSWEARRCSLGGWHWKEPTNLHHLGGVAGNHPISVDLGPGKMAKRWSPPRWTQRCPWFMVQVEIPTSICWDMLGWGLVSPSKQGSKWHFRVLCWCHGSRHFQQQKQDSSDTMIPKYVKSWKSMPPPNPSRLIQALVPGEGGIWGCQPAWSRRTQPHWKMILLQLPKSRHKCV